MVELYHKVHRFSIVFLTFGKNKQFYSVFKEHFYFFFG